MRIAPPHPGRSKDHKWLVYTGREHSFGSEDDMRLPTGFRHSFWNQDDERVVPLLLAPVWAACPTAKGGAPPSTWASKDHKWLLHSSCQYLFGSEDDKRLLPPTKLFIELVPPYPSRSKDHKYRPSAFV